MILERFYDERLAQASYLVGCAATGEAMVIDPARAVDQYLDAGARHGVTITHVTETHIHADFVSGARELHERTDAQLLLSAEGGSDWQYAYAERDGAQLLRDGDEFMIGNIRVQVLHTPGHTPEHISFIITDTAATDIPMGMFTGDFIFVGDVGRPDLLEKAAGVAGTMEAGARDLYASLRKTDTLPGHLQIWPGHGAGSACGKALGAVPSSTLNYERAVNWAFQLDEQGFVDEVLAGQPEPPTYFAEMKRVNREGPTVRDRSVPPRLPASDLVDALKRGDWVIDTRPWKEFRAGFVPGTINIPLEERSFNTWAGWLLSYDHTYHLLSDGFAETEEARAALAAIGLDLLGGVFQWAEVAGHSDIPLTTISEIDPVAVAERQEQLAIVDVRSRREWDEAHIDGATHLRLGDLPAHGDSLPADRPIVVHCETGVRSAIAASLMRRMGRVQVSNLTGGFQAWQRVQSARETPALT